MKKNWNIQRLKAYFYKTDRFYKPTPAPIPEKENNKSDSSSVQQEAVNDSLFLYDFNSWQ